ncbi:uncharacterized protein LOC115927707 [Strongylocentrotus purpuratus]|uniref:P2X purinoreceptor 7 intracellular domain-containing protein n=1 Tax=Strongylocentrotus purpuratus TaxID=7668 RepID=A0A7M7PFX2_STRPU|nr:uncharacterized protein LOC115927707 [Strongylocentrotus purpuratus]
MVPWEQSYHNKLLATAVTALAVAAFKDTTRLVIRWLQAPSGQWQQQYTDSDASDADAGEHGRIVEWEYEPLPRGEPGQNVGDAGRANNANRLHENVEDWCTCGRCRVPPSFNEGDCVCCQELAEVKAEADRQGSSCLVDSEEFEPAILNATTLYIGWMEYTDRWRRAAKAFGDRNNEKYRYVAYRKVMRWCRGWLGKDIRVQLPACVHALIMEAYPDGRGQYKGTILRRLR